MSRPANIADRFNRPYYLETRPGKRWLSCLRTGCFVFLFLIVFQPFGLSELPGGLIPIALGYGLITFSVMAALNNLCIPIFPSFFSEDRWTVAREVYWNLVNVLLIGFANILYSAWLGMVPFTVFSILVFELYTITLAVLPVTLTTFIKEVSLKNKFRKQSEVMNVLIDQQACAVSPVPEKELLVISSENDKEKLHLSLNDLLFIQASDNYIEAHYLDRGVSQKKLLRNSLKSVSASLQQHPNMFRCHKSFLVNTQQVKHISGNAQGYKLHLKDSGQLIPVSRQFNNDLKERLGFNH